MYPDPDCSPVGSPYYPEGVTSRDIDNICGGDEDEYSEEEVEHEIAKSFIADIKSRTENKEGDA